MGLPNYIILFLMVAFWVSVLLATWVCLYRDEGHGRHFDLPADPENRNPFVEEEQKFPTLHVGGDAGDYILKAGYIDQKQSGCKPYPQGVKNEILMGEIEISENAKKALE